MKQENIVQIKSYAFALEIIKLTGQLKSQYHFEISSQLLRSGTSIGANIEEAIGGHSRKDFYAKLTISYKEARETHYWLRLLRDAELVKINLIEPLILDCEELLKLIGSIQKSMKANGI